MARGKAAKLVELLEETRPALETALAEAEQELEELNQRRVELERVIARARAALGDDQSATASGPAASSAESYERRGAQGPAKRLTLHEAMALVLRENRNRWMTVHEVAGEINERGLYEKRDKSLVDPTQIHARASKYPDWFEKDKNDRSRLRLTNQ